MFSGRVVRHAPSVSAFGEEQRVGGTLLSCLAKVYDGRLDVRPRAVAGLDYGHGPWSARSSKSSCQRTGRNNVERILADVRVTLIKEYQQIRKRIESTVHE